MALAGLISKNITSCKPAFINLRGLLDEKFSDCTVTVGHVGSEIKSYKLHRTVLTGCSSVLHQSLAKQQTLDITNMIPDEFERLIVFMYTGDACFHSVSELCFGLYAANLFKLDILVDKCTERLLIKLLEDCENALQIIQFDERFKSRPKNLVLFEMVDEAIQKNYSKLLNNEIIKDLKHETMEQLLQMDSIYEIPEIDVFNSLLKWTTARRDESEPLKQLHDVAGDLFFHIRYNFIPDEMLRNVVAESKLLPPELMERVFLKQLDVPFCTRPRQKWELVSTCTELEHSVHEMSQLTTTNTLIWNGMKGGSEWFSLSAMATSSTRWAVNFFGYSNDDFGIKVRCLSLEKQFRAASVRLFAVVEGHPPVWREGAAVLKTGDSWGWGLFPKKVSELQNSEGIKVQVQVHWTELDQLPPALNMWMDEAACIRCRWQLHGWKTVIPTCDWWSLCSEAFGINGALWRIIVANKPNGSDRKLNVLLCLYHLPELVNCSKLSMNCSLSLWNEQFDDKKKDFRENSTCEWTVINEISLESRDLLDILVSIRITPNN